MSDKTEMKNDIALEWSGMTKLVENGRHYIGMKFSSVKGVSMKTVNDYITKEVSEKLGNRGIAGDLYVNSYFEWRGAWRTSPHYEIGQRIFIYNLDKYELDDPQREKDKDTLFHHFTVYVNPKVQQAEELGGDDNSKNDCLYSCLINFFGETELHKYKKIKLPSKLKKFLNLERCDLVPVECLTKLGEYLKVNIIVKGNVKYEYKNDHTKTINLLLTKNHFTLETKQKVSCFGMSYEEKTEVLIYKKVSERIKGNKWTHYYDCFASNNGAIQIDPQDFNKNYKYCPQSCPYVLVKYDGEDAPCIKQVKEFRTVATELKTASNNVINLFKFGTNFPQIARYLFNILQKEQITPEAIDIEESNWLHPLGGLVYVAKDYEGKAFESDINSEYPALLQRSDKTYPYKKGIFQTVDDNFYFKKNFYPYGVYRCVVTPSGNTTTDGHFRFNYDHKYSHTDLTTARELKLDIKMIMDNKPNALLYPANCRRTGKDMFGSTIWKLYELKSDMSLSKQTRDYAKLILNSFWGSLCAKKTLCVRANQDGNIEIPAHSYCKKIDEDNGIAITVSYADTFQTAWARIGVFLTSFGRQEINKYLPLDMKNVIRVHTDGILWDCVPLHINHSDKLGEMKIQTGHLTLVKGSNVKIFDKTKNT